MGNCVVPTLAPLPKVVIDARMVSEIPHGIARYVTLLARGLREIHDQQKLAYEPVFLIQQKVHFSDLNSFETVKLNSPFLNPKELFEIPKVLKKLGAAIYHSPSFSSLWNCPCPSVVTIHDLNHLTYGGLSKKLYYKLLLKNFARRSKVIATVSEFSRNEIAQWLKIPKSKIEVVYNAIEPKHPNELRSRPEYQAWLEKQKLKSNRYFICVSNPKPHKNLELLVKSYQNYRKQVQDPWPLVLLVKDFAQVPGIRALGGTSEVETSTLIANAAGLLFPSLYEGFGLPPVEGASMGTRVAASLIPPHQEGLQDLASHEVLWVKPTDFHGWTRAFHQIQQGVLSNPSAENSQKILDRFSVKKLALHMDQIYRHMLKVEL